VRMSILGGTGSTIASGAAQRGHAVTTYSRQLPDDRVAGVEYEAGSVLHRSVRAQALDGVAVVVVALARHGDMVEQMRPAVAS
jgi:putative NADH-flavin reductase